jgi:protein-S-isoprenylcysteine O-methyltransferase Ste14
MAISQEFEAHGQWLFRWRGYLPLLLVTLFPMALHGYRWPFHSYVEYEFWARCCFGLSILGLAIRCVTVGYTPAGTSGRNTTRQVADQLNTTGMYSLLRHPLYLGNFFIGLGISLAPAVWWLPVIYCLLFCIHYERIMFAEEAFLHRSFGKEFDDWASATPAFIPRHSDWRKPALPFSFRNVMRREYTGLIVVILGNAAVQFTEHLIIEHRVVYEVFWVTLLIVGTATYFALKSLKKRTSLLDVPGR